MSPCQKRLIVLLLGFSSMMGGPVTVSAADMGGSLKDHAFVEPVAASPFDGFYLGGFGGWGGAKFKGIIDSGELPDNPEDTEAFNGKYEKGAVFGGYLGYNIVRSGWVWGWEADVSSGDISAFTQDSDGSDNAKQKLNWMGSVRGRVGALLDSNTLLYATGGIGYLSTKISASNDIDVDNETGSKNLSSVGFIGGAGFERMLTQNIGLRFEGLYFAGSKRHTLADETLHSDQDEGDYAKVEGVYQIRAGLTYNF